MLIQVLQEGRALVECIEIQRAKCVDVDRDIICHCTDTTTKHDLQVVAWFKPLPVKYGAPCTVQELLNLG